MLFISLFFAIIAWVIPILKITNTIHKDYIGLALSFLFCAAAVMCFFIDIKNRCVANDFGGIIDTIGADIFIVGLIMGITIILNTIMIYKK